MILKRLFVILLVLTSLKVYSQDDFQMWYKLSPEIRMNIEKTPFEFRWRPIDYTALPEIKIARTDIMAGLTFKHFKLFSYSKFDNLGRSWTGVRFDFNTSLFDKKLLINIQERYFWGLNDASSQHYYLIQYIRYRFGQKIQAGLLSYGKWDPTEAFNEGHWFAGPVADFKLPHNFNFMVAIAKDVFYKGIHMTFARVGYRINIKRKPIDEDED